MFASVATCRASVNLKVLGSYKTLFLSELVAYACCAYSLSVVSRSLSSPDGYGSDDEWSGDEQR
jgi:hypothetical protein